MRDHNNIWKKSWKYAKRICTYGYTAPILMVGSYVILMLIKWLMPFEIPVSPNIFTAVSGMVNGGVTYILRNIFALPFILTFTVSGYFLICQLTDYISDNLRWAIVIFDVCAVIGAVMFIIFYYPIAAIIYAILTVISVIRINELEWR